MNDTKISRILITGGPVGANLDSVKIVTNRFRGGRAAALAERFSQWDAHVTYLTTKHAVLPFEDNPQQDKVKVVYHDGFEDYREKVKELAKESDAVILMAAVCNLLPVRYFDNSVDGAWETAFGNPIDLPLKGKFPSHNFKPSDTFRMDWKIAPRIIDEVKEANPKTLLFGFKLLKGVPHDELIEAAYDIVLESNATAVFANDRNNLDTKYAVTKEHAVHKLEDDSDGELVFKFVVNRLKEQYYKTSNVLLPYNTDESMAVEEAKKLVDEYSDKFKKTYGDNRYVFGTVAARIGDSTSFATTARGKTEIEDFTVVESVRHDKRLVLTHPKKATLNAPLLEYLFSINPNVKYIIHFHERMPGMDLEEYATPGTDIDSMRDCHESFLINAHGTFYLLDENKEII